MGTSLQLVSAGISPEFSIHFKDEMHRVRISFIFFSYILHTSFSNEVKSHTHNLKVTKARVKMSKLAKTVQGFLNMSNKNIQKSFSTNSIIQKSMREKKL